MCRVPQANLRDSGNGAPQDPYAADAVVSGILLCQSGQAGHLRRCADVDAGTSYKTAWYMLMRIRTAMGQRDKTHRLNGIIEFDDACFGGPTVGKKRGRGTEKAKVFAAVSLGERGNPLYAKMRVTRNIKRASVKKFAQAAFTQGSTIHSDGYGSYIPALEGFTHEHKPYDPHSGLLHWLHIVISNAKAFILGTYHGLPKKYLQAYLDEYCFRFSPRDFGPRLLERLVLAVGTPVRLS